MDLPTITLRGIFTACRGATVYKKKIKFRFFGVGNPIYDITLNSVFRRKILLDVSYLGKINSKWSKKKDFYIWRFKLILF